ncbi:TPA: hypothetical protein ACKQH2_005335 [Serratia marcescens]
MVRHYGFLANRKRGTLQPKVYEALDMTPREKPQKPGFTVLMKGFLGTDSYQCILCKGRLSFAGAMASEHATKKCSLTGCSGSVTKPMASDPFSE